MNNLTLIANMLIIQNQNQFGIACVAVVATTVGVGSWAGTKYGGEGGAVAGEILCEKTLP
ncbi:hypothetical protein ACIQVE_28915 [Pseudomonas sp. NPDC098747]|uniref:hypothetical protein n=1 Tax=Pseudomonas sp. NPDC098747 TaxID=3364487 RepID=UPI00383A78F6